MINFKRYMYRYELNWELGVVDYDSCAELGIEPNHRSYPKHLVREERDRFNEANRRCESWAVFHGTTYRVSRFK